MRVDRKFKNLACILKIDVSDPAMPLPDEYSIALIDLERNCPKGFVGRRIEGIDRELVDHHRKGAICHRHYIDQMDTSCIDFIGDASFPKQCDGTYPASIGHICEFSCRYFCSKNPTEYDRFFDALNYIESHEAYGI